jgi:hypothetical protein
MYSLKIYFSLKATKRNTWGMYAFIKTTFLVGNRYLNTLPEPGMPKTVGLQLTFHHE